MLDPLNNHHLPPPQRIHPHRPQTKNHLGPPEPSPSRRPRQRPRRETQQPPTPGPISPVISEDDSCLAKEPTHSLISVDRGTNRICTTRAKECKSALTRQRAQRSALSTIVRTQTGGGPVRSRNAGPTTTNTHLRTGRQPQMDRRAPQRPAGDPHADISLAGTTSRSHRLPSSQLGRLPEQQAKKPRYSGAKAARSGIVNEIKIETLKRNSLPQGPKQTDDPSADSTAQRGGHPNNDEVDSASAGHTYPQGIQGMLQTPKMLAYFSLLNTK